MENSHENVIEFLRDTDTATVTFTQGRFITRVKELAKKNPHDVKIIAENSDGSICAHVPVAYIKLNPKREYTDEQLEVMRERAKSVFGSSSIDGVKTSNTGENDSLEDLFV